MKRTIKDFIFEKSLLFLALLTLAGLAGIVWFFFKEGMPVLDPMIKGNIPNDGGSSVGYQS